MFCASICLPVGYPPVRQSGKVVRGGSWNNNSDNARCAYRNSNQPDNRNNNLGFRVVLRSAHVFLALLLVPASCGTVRLYECASDIPEMPFDSSESLAAEAKEEEQRQACLVRAQSRRYWGVASAGRIQKMGAAWSLYPPRSPPKRYFAARLCLIQPPSNFPMVATIRLTCSY